jgi:hypothetical protein
VVEVDITVSIAKLCRCFGVPRRTVYYKPMKSVPKVDPRSAVPIKAMIEDSPLVWLSDGCTSVGVQQEHRATCLPVDGLTGPQAAHWLQTPHPGPAIGGDDA